MMLLSLAGLLAIDLYRRHAEVSLQEQQRLVSLASAINVNMAEQLRASSRMGMPLVRKNRRGGRAAWLTQRRLVGRGHASS